jgi:hypothetical protein
MLPRILVSVQVFCVTLFCILRVRKLLFSSYDTATPEIPRPVDFSFLQSLGVEVEFYQLRSVLFRGRQSERLGRKCVVERYEPPERVRADSKPRPVGSIYIW